MEADDGSDSDLSDDGFFDLMVAAAAKKGRDEEEGNEALGKTAAAKAGQQQQQQQRGGAARGARAMSEEEALEERWIEAVLNKAEETTAIRDEADPVWWDEILQTVALSGPSPTFGRTDGAYPIDSESKGLLLRKFLQDTRGMPRAAPFVRGRPLGGPAEAAVGDWAWHLDNLAQPKAALGVRTLGGDRHEIALHAMETGAAVSLLSCVLASRSGTGEGQSLTVLHLDPLHESAIVKILDKTGSSIRRRRLQQLYAVPPSQPPPARAPSPLEADGRGDENNPISPPKPPLKMPRDRTEHSVVLRQLHPAEALPAAAASALRGALGVPGVEAHALYYESELACCVESEPRAAWVRDLWTSPSYRGRGLERRLLFHLLRQWRASSAAAASSRVGSGGGGGAVVRYLPLMWVDAEGEGGGGSGPRSASSLPEDALASLGFAPIEGVAGVGVTLECGGARPDDGDGMALG